MNPIRVNKFQGMSDILSKNQNLETPSIILNANADAGGSLTKRDGSTKVIDLEGAHSLWTSKDGITFCMAKGVLYLITGGNTATILVDTAVTDSLTSYIEISGNIYISNAYWTGIYDVSNNVVEDWGTPIPSAPSLSTTTGDLPAGTYSVCFTTLGFGGRPSGNSNITTITLDDVGGIAISNLAVGDTVWMTDPDSGIFYYIGYVATITTTPTSPEPIPTMWGAPPLPMSCILYAHGRVWGSVGPRLYYSEPYQPELFTLSESYIDMGSAIGIIAVVNGGLYIGCQDNTFFLTGTNPDEMTQKMVSVGVVPGTLCYASSLGELGANVPIWVGRDGVYAGSLDGRAFNLSKDKIKMSPEQTAGVSFYQVKNGQTRMMVGYKQDSSGQNMAVGDNAACEVVRKGTVI